MRSLALADAAGLRIVGILSIELDRAGSGAANVDQSSRMIPGGGGGVDVSAEVGILFEIAPQEQTR